jgi:anti-anti-sigma factor
MKTQSNNDVLSVSDLDRLTSTNSKYFKETVGALIEEKHRHVEIDCSALKYMDSEGLGALIWANKLVALRNGAVRLNRVQPMIRQLLELVKFQQLIEINP